MNAYQRQMIKHANNYLQSRGYKRAYHKDLKAWSFNTKNCTAWLAGLGVTPCNKGIQISVVGRSKVCYTHYSLQKELEWHIEK